MRYERDLQSKLEQRYSRIYGADYNAFRNAVQYFRDFIQGTPALRAITENLENTNIDVDPDVWVGEKFSMRTYSWPETESGQAKIVWRLVNRWADGEDPYALGDSFSSDNNLNYVLRDMTDQTIRLFVEYLVEQLGSASQVLYMLERFKRRVEWFDQAELYAKYEADTKHGEDGYDTHLRKFLFDQGIDYPFSQPKSASGQVDVVAGLDGDDPLVCEVKLYDPSRSGYGVPYVAKGFRQALDYAHDYGKSVAHLVTFNLSGQGLQMPTDEGSKPWPPRLHVEGVTVYLVTVNAKPRPSASQRGRATPRIVTRDELVNLREDRSDGS
ncbi:hypothetical protein [Streptomyces sp. 351MFTsu5.1]|uniref:hypothetical protein n=1 Tax=Streptomyces sp. 351MFTsu5.1 TaxID=1172180 RepID=UPI001319C2EC|nr:hypothetical protein [Streptomyces sp. 351MFTsu5.1]